MKPQRGFTLIELVVVVIILAVLSAIALPKFINLGVEARVAAVTSLSGGIRSAANMAYAGCLINGDPSMQNQFGVSIGTTPTTVHYCWLDAGDGLNAGQIDSWVTYTGFTASLVDTTHTRFSLDGAPDPVNCSVTYEDAFNRGQALGMGLVQTTTGC